VLLPPAIFLRSSWNQLTTTSGSVTGEASVAVTIISRPFGTTSMRLPGVRHSSTGSPGRSVGAVAIGTDITLWPRR
jgi:hypothetical protein